MNGSDIKNCIYSRYVTECLNKVVNKSIERFKLNDSTYQCNKRND